MVKRIGSQKWVHIESIKIDISLDGGARFDGVERLDCAACLRCRRSEGIPIGTEAIIADPGEAFFCLLTIRDHHPSGFEAHNLVRNQQVRLIIRNQR